MKSTANSVSELPESSSSPAALVDTESVLSQSALSNKTLSSNKLSSKKMYKTKMLQANKFSFSISKRTHIHIASKSGKDSQMTYVYAAILPSSFFILGMLFIMSFMH